MFNATAKGKTGSHGHGKNELGLDDSNKFDILFQCSNDAILIIDPAADQVLDVNQAASALLKNTREEIVKMTLTDVYPDKDKLDLLVKEVNDCGQSWTDQLVCQACNGQIIQVEISASAFRHNETDCILTMARDVSKRHKVEEELQDRLVLEELVSDISREFLQVRSDKLKACIDKTLARVGKHCKVDRCYLFLARHQDGYLLNTNEWVDNKIPALIDIQNTKANKDFDWIHRQLRKYKVVHITDIEKLPKQEKKLASHLRSMNIKSTLSVPMHYDHELIGFLGFDSTRDKKHWKDQDIQLLSVIGDIIVNALERISFENDLLKLNRTLEELNDELEEKVVQRTHEVIEKNSKLTNYAFYNAHKLRGPLARLLGLINLFKLEYIRPGELPAVISKLDEAAQELDAIVKEINKIVT